VNVSRPLPGQLLLSLGSQPPKTLSLEVCCLSCGSATELVLGGGLGQAGRLVCCRCRCERFAPRRPVKRGGVEATSRDEVEVKGREREKLAGTDYSPASSSLDAAVLKHGAAFGAGNHPSITRTVNDDCAS
jgi:hypothetical protein